MARKERADRGKYAEKKTREYLKSVGESNSKFDWERKYDARAARGRFPSQAGDFGWYAVDSAGFKRHGLIEDKEVAHAFRLPKKSFGDLQEETGTPKKFGVLRKRMLAGGEITILVYHTTTELWRAIDATFFFERAKQPSWDLSEFPTYKTVAEALASRGFGEFQR